MSAVYTITKAPSVVALTVENVTAENGFLTVTVSGKNLKDDYFLNKCSANVTLCISDGNNDLTSEYIQMVPWTRDVISFADANFKAYCVENFDTDADGEISEDEAKAVTAIDCSLGGLTSLVGIEYFSNLETIDVSLNKITSLDLSHSPKLTDVTVNGNKLQSLNLSGLSQLKTLNCSDNKLGTLDVSESAGLTSLICSGNELGTLNLRTNKALTELQCSNNNLTALDLKNNTALELLYCRKNNLVTLNMTILPNLRELDCSYTGITVLNLYKNTKLENLYCSSNALTGLGLAANTGLVMLDCSKNQITSLDLSKNLLLETVDCSDNQLTSLDVSGNSELLNVTCDGNTSMAKLWVKDEAQKDALTIKKEDTTTIAYNDGGVVFQDAALKSYMLALFDDDGDGEISIAEAENVENVNCSGRGISSIVGLQDCPNLTYLNLNGNNVSTIDLPNLQKLETIVAYGNPVSKINVNNDTALKEFYLQDVSTNALSGTAVTITAYDQAATLDLAFAGTEYTTLNLTGSSVLTSYDIDENIQLTKLVASGNSLVTGVDVSTLTSLTHLDLNACGLTSLNVDTNVELDYFDCSSNALTALNVDNNTALVTFDCSDNQLGTIKVTNNTALDKLDVSKNQLLNVNVRNNTVLKTLNISDNMDISAMTLRYNTVLEDLNASNTGLTDIDLSYNLALKTLNLSGCAGMHIIDLVANTALTDLNVNSTSLSTLDVSANTALESLDVSSTSLTTLDVSANTALTHLNVEATEMAKIVIASSPVKTYRGLEVGQYVEIDAVSGVVYDISSSRPKVVSIDETDANWSNAKSWCTSKGSAWYLPSNSELKVIYKNKATLNSTLSSVGGTQLGTGYYWSSTEDSSNHAYNINFSGGLSSNYHKNSTCSVRSVRAL